MCLVFLSLSIYLSIYICVCLSVRHIKTKQKQLYAVAQQYDLLIVEDDPYRLLYLPEDVDETRCVSVSVRLSL